MLSRIIETSDDWVRERSGIVDPLLRRARRRLLRPRSARRRGRPSPTPASASDEVDYLVCATMTPDHYFPGTGTLIQQKLGLRPLPALDIRQQCAGFAYGLQMVDALIRERHRAHRPAGRLRRPHLADAVLGAHLRGAPRPRSRARSRPRTSSGTRASATCSCCSATAPGPWSSAPQEGGGRRARHPRLGPLRRRQPQGHPLRARAAARRGVPSSAAR